MPSPTPEVADPRVTKRRVTCRRVTLGADGTVYTEEKVDYVRPDFLDSYTADARGTWQQVEVSDAPDAGPAGYDGATYVPAGLPVADAGVYYAATGADEAAAAAAVAALGLSPAAIITTPVEG